jgi:hypothetical protein
MTEYKEYTIEVASSPQELIKLVTKKSKKVGSLLEVLLLHLFNLLKT